MPTTEFNKVKEEGKIYRVAVTPTVEIENLGNGHYTYVQTVKFTHLDQQ